ncbi:hypothetical protein [Streptomyces sp. NPDC002676]
MGDPSGRRHRPRSAALRPDPAPVPDRPAQGIIAADLPHLHSFANGFELDRDAGDAGLIEVGRCGQL